MDIVDVQVQLDKKLAQDPIIGKSSFRVFELFGNSEDLLFQDTFHKISFLDSKNQEEIFLSFASRFEPDGLTDAERIKLLQQQQALMLNKEKKETDLEGLLKKRPSAKRALDLSQTEEADNTFTARQDQEVFSLNLANLPLFENNTRGMLILRLQTVVLVWPARQLDTTHLFLVFKSSKMMYKTKVVQGSDTLNFGDVIQMKIFDAHETIQVKLFDFNQGNIMLANATIDPKALLKETRCWTREYLSLEMAPIPSILGAKEAQIALKAHFQYRCSQFTRSPIGKLEVIFIQGLDMKLDNEAYNPLMELRVNQQRVIVDEDVNSTKAHWKQRLIQFQTTSIWDTFEIRFYDDSVTQDINLLGSLGRSLSSIYYDDDAFSDIKINLSTINNAISGSITLQLQYYPQRNGVEHQSNRNNQQSGNKNQSSDTKGLDKQLTVTNKQKGVCYLTVQEIELKGIPKGGASNMRNIRFEIIYEKSRNLTRITTDLAFTENKECMGDQFRLLFQDLTRQREPESQITIKAYHVNFQYQGTDDEQKVSLIGETTLDPTLIRLNAGFELHMQCAIPISRSDLQTNVFKLLNKQKDSNDKAQEILDMLNDVDNESKAKLDKPELLISFNIFYLTTTFTRNPVGILTINELSLLNLSNFLADLNLKDSSLLLKFKLNGNRLSSQNAQLLKNAPLIKEHMCLFHQEYDPGEIVKGGKSFYIRAKEVQSYYTWAKQIVLFTGQSLDSLDIQLIEQKIVGPQEGRSTKKALQVVLAHVTINMADLSYFTDMSPMREVSLAMLMDFQAHLALSSTAQKMPTKSSELINQIKQQKLASSKDLLSRSFANELILLMDFKFHTETFLERNLIQNLKSHRNVFCMPKEVAYNDYINSEFDSIIQRHKDSQHQAQTPLASKQSGVDGSSARHVLLEFNLIQLTATLRLIKQSQTLYGFLVLEPLRTKDPIKNYMDIVMKQVKNYKKDRTILNNQNEFGETPFQTNKKTKAIPKEFGEIIQDFMARPEDLLKPEKQVTKIFAVSDFELHRINQILEVWVPLNTQKIMLSMVVQVDDNQKLSEFRQQVLDEHLSKQLTLLGLLKQREIKELRAYQSMIDISDLADTTQHENAASQVFIQNTNLAELITSSTLLKNPLAISQALVRTKIQTSDFIDTPSGILNVVLKRMSHNSPHFNQDNFVRLTLKSKVSKDSLSFSISNFSDTFATQESFHYKKRSEKSSKITISFNEVANFIGRHYSDLLQIQLVNMKDNNVLLTTHVGLNDLELNQEKVSIMVVGTSAMRTKGPPIYYTFEMDLLFKVRLSTDSEQSTFDMAIQNYRLMKNSDKITRGEEEIIKMMLERMQMAKNLTPSKIRMRKCRFLLRNLQRTSYHSLDMNQQSLLKVNPKSFFFNINDQREQMSQFKYQEVTNDIMAEFNHSNQEQPDLSRYKNIALDSSTQLQKSNILIIQVVSGITIVPPGQPCKYKKLVLVATQDSQTIFKQTFDKKQIMNECLLQGTNIAFKNVKPNSMLSFRLLVEEESEGLHHAKESGDAKLNPICMGAFKVSSLSLKSWQTVDKAIALQKFTMKTKVTLLHSEFTKNPHKVVNFTFHRLLNLQSSEITVKNIQQVESTADNGKQKKPQQLNQFKIVMKEEPIISKSRSKTSQNAQGVTEKPQCSTSTGGAQLGSINQVLQEQMGNQNNQTRYRLLIEFDNCLEYKGTIKDERLIDLNECGKSSHCELSKLQINNTESGNQVTIKLCVDTFQQPKAGTKLRQAQHCVIGICSFNLAEVQSLPNKALNIFIPIKAIEADQSQLSQQWANKNFGIKDLYMLASIEITDKTFGELSIDIDQFDCIPRSLALRDIQWRVSVKSEKDPNDPLMGITNSSNKNEVFNQLSTRIPYDINLSQVKVGRQMIIHLLMKDIFSDVDSFLRPSALQLNQEQDLQLIFEVLAFDEYNTLIVLGQKKLSMIHMIQMQMMLENSKGSFGTTQSSVGNMESTGAQNMQNLNSSAKNNIESEFSGCSAKFQRLCKDTYEKFSLTKEQQTKEEEDKKVQRKKKKQEESGEQSSSKKERGQLPEGYSAFILKVPELNEGDLQEIAQPKELKGQDPVEMIVKVQWNFSYKLRAEHSQNYNEFKEELNQMERIKLRKQISNLLDTLDQVRSVPALTNQNLQTLALVLASESCLQLHTEEDILENQALTHMDKIIEVLVSLYKDRERKLPATAIINIMRCISYLKILSEVSEHHAKQFQEGIQQSHLVAVMLEQYEEQGSNKSKTLSIEFLNFFSNLLSDFNAIYFEHISGVRLDPLLDFINIGDKDINIILSYAKFLNAVGQCLFNCDEATFTSEEEDNERRKALVKMDMIKISQSIDKQLVNLVDGLNVFKNAYEVAAGTLCQAALQFVHVVILKNHIVQGDEGMTMSDIMLNLFKILVDGMISQLSLSFVTDLKKRLNYEISMIRSLDLKRDLHLNFDVRELLRQIPMQDGILLGMLKRVTEHFQAVIQGMDLRKREYAIRFFEKTKLIFEFFATDFCINAFAENERNTIKSILRDKSLEDHDFVLFLHNVVKIDVEIEDSVEGENAQERKARTMKEKYGGLTKVNKFSLSRIEWLENDL